MTRDLPPHARLLRLDPEPIAGHPEGWGEDPALDSLLEAIHSEEWPRDEWLGLEDCRHVHLDPYESYWEALGALRLMRREARAELRRLRYGPVLMRTPGGELPEFRRRLQRKARLRLVAMWLLCWPLPCRCGAYHVRPLLGSGSDD